MPDRTVTLRRALVVIAALAGLLLSSAASCSSAQAHSGNGGSERSAKPTSGIPTSRSFWPALGIAVVSLADTISTASSSFAAHSGQMVDGSTEMKGIGRRTSQPVCSRAFRSPRMGRARPWPGRRVPRPR